MVTQTLRSNELTFIFNGAYRTTTDYDPIASKFDHDWAIALTNGTGSGNANFAYQDQLTIAATAGSTVNLFALTDAFGNAIAPARAKVVAIRLTSSADTAASLTVGAAGSDVFSPMFGNDNDVAIVRYQGWVVFACLDATGYVIDNTNKNLLITNNSATQSVTVDLVVIGVK
jgi:hypothetical protein